MNELFVALIGCLKEEAACYRRLALLARDQKDLLVAANVKVLPNNTRLQEKQVFALTPIIGRKEEVLAKLAKMFVMRKMDLKTAAKNAPAEVSENFNNAMVDLVQAAKELSSVNDLSEKLLNNAVNFTKFTLKVIREGGKKKTLSLVGAPEAKTASFVNRVV